MNKFLETHKLFKPIQENTESLSRYITNKKITSLIKNLPMKKSLGWYVFFGELYGLFKEELTPNPAKTGTLPKMNINEIVHNEI